MTVKRNPVLAPRLGSTLAAVLLVEALAAHPAMAQAVDLDALPLRQVEITAQFGEIDHPELAFSRIADLGVGPDGHLYLAQPQDSRVTVLTRDGQVVRHIGRRGSGPGEFMSPGMVGWFADTLWVLDTGTRRATLFHGDEVVRTQQQRAIEPTLAESVAAVFPEPTGASLVLVRRNPGPQGRAPNHNGYLIHVDPAGERHDTVGVLEENYPVTTYLGNLRTPPLVQDFPHLGVLRSGEGAVVVDRPFPEGPRSEIRVSRMDTRGDTLFTIRLEGDAVPFEDRHWVERFRARASAFEQRGSSVDPDDFLTAQERPAYHAPASHLVSGSAGWTWIAREDLPDHDEREWVALDPEGVPQFRVLLPSTLRMYDADGEEVWGVIPGRFDEDIIRGFRIRH